MIEIGECKIVGTVRMVLPAVIIRHDGVNALVEVEDAERTHSGYPKHHIRSAAVIVRVRQAVGMTQFVQHHSKRVTALYQRNLVAGDVLLGNTFLVPAAAVDVESADALLRAVVRILRVQIGTEIFGRGGEQTEGCFVRVGGDFIIYPEDRLELLECKHHLLDFVRVPAIGGSVFADILTSRTEIDIGGIGLVELHVRGIYPIDRIERVEIFDVYRLGSD